MWSLSALNNYTRDLPQGPIVANEITDVGFFRALAKHFDQKDFPGLNIDHLLKTGRPLRGTAHAEGQDMPRGGSPSYKLLKLPLAELITNAELTSQALDRATGMPGSWGRVVDDAIADEQEDFELLKCISAIGNGKGYLATVKSATSDGTTVTVTCDNTYITSQWDNVQMMRVGMLIEVYAADGTTARANAAGKEVLSVTFGDRKNTGTVPDGTFTIAGATDLSIADNDIVYIYGTQSKVAATAGSEGVAPARALPMGMGYMAQNGLAFSGLMCEANAYGLPRANYTALRARIFGAADDAAAGVTGFGLTSETPVYGTPTYWDLSAIDNMIMEVKRGSGKGKINVMVCNSRLAGALMSRSVAKWGVNVVIDAAKSVSKQVVGNQLPTVYIAPDGSVINIEIEEFFPNNCLLMFDSRDISMHQPMGGFDYKRLYGDIWGPTKGTRTTDFEAPYGGYLQFSAERFDNIVFAMDLRDDI